MKKVVASVILGTAAMFAPATAQVPVNGTGLAGAGPQGMAAVGTPLIKAAAAAPIVTAGIYNDMRSGGTAAWGASDSESSSPGSSIAWLGALGFLGLVVMRRLSSPNF
ncbi:MAG TPA: hypothetical protein VFK48_02390 [Usitatibacter sp.]|nr:hypothetical protein [Usitatibacter sp.]